MAVPPPLNIYNWVYPIEIKDNSLNRSMKIVDETYSIKYNFIMNMISEFSLREKILFINPLNDLKRIAKNDYFHGKRDSKHPSIKGYEHIAKIISLQNGN